MRTTLCRGAIAFAVLLAVMAAPALAQSLVRGVVYDAKKTPVEGAIITFEAESAPSTRDTKTDKRGQFIFMGLSSGEYKVTAAKEGVGSDTLQVTIKQTKMEFEFVLKPEAAKASVGLDSLAAGAATPDAEKEAAAKRNSETAALQALASTAMEAHKSGRHEEAVTQLNELITKLPTCADCYMYLGNSYAALSRPAEAEAALKKSVELTPTVEGYTALTRFYNSQKKFDLAGEASKKATELAGGPAAAAGGGASSETLYNQGVVLWNSGKFAEAKTQFEAAVAADPANADAQYQLGMANLNLGQIAPARTAFEAYLKAAPEGAKAAEVKAMLAQLPK